MLHQPDHQPHLVSVCGIDPGTNYLGFACLGVDSRTWEIETCWATTIRVDKLPESPGFDLNAQSERLEKLLKIKSSVKQLLAYWKPVHLSCESPFHNRLRPAAYEPLVESVLAVRLASYEFNPALKFDTLAPSVIKKTVGAGHISGKDMVKKAVMDNPTIQTKSTVNLGLLDEHAIDALAVAYSRWKLSS